MTSFNVTPFHLYDTEHNGAVQRHASNIWVGIIFFYYIQINEIQESIDEITCIFQKVFFSLVKNIKSIISLVKNTNFCMTFAFSWFPL